MVREIWPYELELKEFRSFRDVKIKLGKRITVISGQNGVGKSNILSLIALASGINKKSAFGSKFQPNFYDFLMLIPINHLIHTSYMLSFVKKMVNWHW